MLQYNGYLSFIVPDNLFSGNRSDSYQVLINNQVPFVSFNPSNQLFFPGIQQYICYFLLHKHSPGLTTIIEHDDTNKFTIHLEDRPVNPVRSWTPHSEKLVKQFVSNERNQVVYNRGKSLNLYKGNKYPIIYTPDKTVYTNNLDLAAGYGQKKAIIFAISVNLAFKMDYLGNVGAGPNTFYIPFKTIADGKKLKTFLKSDTYKELALATKTTRQYLKIAFIEHLKLDKIVSKGKQTNKLKNKKINKNTRKRK